MYNPNWYYNPQCFNQQTFFEYQQQMQQYQQLQNEEVGKAFHAYKDFLDAYSKLDSAHQQELFVYCLSDFASRNHWQDNYELLKTFGVFYDIMTEEERRDLISYLVK